MSVELAGIAGTAPSDAAPSSPQLHLATWVPLPRATATALPLFDRSVDPALRYEADENALPIAVAPTSP